MTTKASETMMLLKELLGTKLGDKPVEMFLASGSADETFEPAYRRLQTSTEVGATFRNCVVDLQARLSSARLRMVRYDPGASLPNLRVIDSGDLVELEYVDLKFGDHSHVSDQLQPLLTRKRFNYFKGESDFLKELRFYVVSFLLGGERFCFYRLSSPKIELSRSHLFGLTLHKGALSDPEERILLFDRHFDCFSFGGTMFVLRKGPFHQMFRHYDYVKRSARKTLDAIARVVPIENFEDFRNNCRGSVKLGKLMRISRRPYLTGGMVPMDRVRRVIKEFSLSIEIVGPEGAERLRYEPDKEWEFLRLLDDDYLVSHMTDEGYEATAKRSHSYRPSAA